MDHVGPCTLYMFVIGSVLLFKLGRVLKFDICAARTFLQRLHPCRSKHE